jgi:hypothetical protein
VSTQRQQVPHLLALRARPSVRRVLVLTLFLLLVLTWLVLAGFLAAFTIWFQGYIYEQPVGQMYWRAPAASTSLALFIALWVTLDYNSPGGYRGLFEFTVKQDEEPYKELYAVNQSWQEEKYVLKTMPQGPKKYVREGDNKELSYRPLAVIVIDNKQRVLFAPEVKEGKFELVESGGTSQVVFKDKDGNTTDNAGRPAVPIFKTPKDGSLRYINSETRREMLEGQFGLLSSFRWWWLFRNLFFNLFHFAVWLAALWLLLKFQFWHSFGLGVVMWLAMTIIIMPPLFTKAEEIAHERATPVKTAG